jgi:hypothetical protein
VVIAAAANKDPDHFSENFRIEVQFSPVEEPEKPPVTPKALQYLLGSAPVLHEEKFREYLERNFLVRNPTEANALIARAPRVGAPGELGTPAMISVPEFASSDGCIQLCTLLNFRSDVSTHTARALPLFVSLSPSMHTHTHTRMHIHSL